LAIRWSDLFWEEILAEYPAAIREMIVSARACEAEPGSPPGVRLQTLVSGAYGATNFSTGIARFEPGAGLPCHLHSFSEAVTVIEGRAGISVEGRTYRLRRRDCVHIPSGTAHRVLNEDPAEELIAHWAFASATPSRTLTGDVLAIEDRGEGVALPSDPETVVRYEDSSVYELSKHAFFIDLFARRFGSMGICGGHGRFLPGASLPCHIHDFDESITIVRGRAACLVEGRRYELGGCDAAFVPRGIPHRFLNQSNEEMEMVWVYAGNEPDRRVVASGYCAGGLAWPGAGLAVGGEQ
jgi:quercetin dioxygenase-like cupin family protein